MKSEDQKIIIRVGLIACVSLSMVACGGNAKFSEGNSAASVGAVPVSDSGVPACVIDVPQAVISGNVNAFEFSGSFGLTFGYSPSGPNTSVGGSASVKVSTATMDVSMLAVDPLSRVLMTTTDVGSNQTSTNINATIDFSQFSAGPSFYFQTPLAQVSLKGLTTGVSNLKNQLDNLSGMSWVGRVLQVNNSGASLVINAGSLAGVQVGDTFSIYDVEHFWQGAPCASSYFGSQHSPMTPVAQIKITSVSLGTSFGTVSFQDASNPVKLGSEVIAKTLAGSGRYLKKKIVLGKISASHFTLPGGGDFDFEGAMNSQILTVLSTAGFVQ
jgi:hypothetical protein